MTARPRSATTTLAGPNRLVLLAATTSLVALASVGTALLVVTGTSTHGTTVDAVPPLPTSSPLDRAPGVVVLPPGQAALLGGTAVKRHKSSPPGGRTERDATSPVRLRIPLALFTPAPQVLPVPPVLAFTPPAGAPPAPAPLVDPSAGPPALGGAPTVPAVPLTKAERRAAQRALKDAAKRAAKGQETGQLVQPGAASGVATLLRGTDGTSGAGTVGPAPQDRHGDRAGKHGAQAGKHGDRAGKHGERADKHGERADKHGDRADEHAAGAGEHAAGAGDQVGDQVGDQAGKHRTHSAKHRQKHRDRHSDD